MPTIPTRHTHRPRPALATLLAVLLLCIATPGQAQRLTGALTGTDGELQPGMRYDTYTLHCVGGEALRLSLVGEGFHGRLLVQPPHGDLISSVDARLIPEWGTSLDLIATHPGDYTVLVLSFDEGTTGRYILKAEPLTRGMWVTAAQGIRQSENGRVPFGLLAMSGATGRLLAYCEDHAPSLSLAAGQAGGTQGPAASFAQGRGVELPVTFEGVGMPGATVSLADGGEGEVHYAYQFFVSQEEVEHQRAITPQATLPGSFPDGSRETSFTVELSAGQYFFAFVAAEGLVQPAAPGQAGQAPGPTPADYLISAVDPEGRPIGADGAVAYAAQFVAPAAGTYTVRVAGKPEVPDTFTLGFSMGRDVPELDAMIRWSTGAGRMIVNGTLDDEGELLGDRRSDAYGVLVKAGDRVAIDAWSDSDGLRPSIIVVTPDEQRHDNAGLEGSRRHARVGFVAEQDGLCTIFIVGRAAQDAGGYSASFGVAPAGGIVPGDDPYHREDPTAGGWDTRYRMAGTIDNDDLLFEDLRYDSTFIEVKREDRLRLVLVADGYRADLYLGLPDGTELEGQYDPATNSSIITLPTGVEGDVDMVITTVRPGDTGAYTIQVQQRE